MRFLTSTSDGPNYFGGDKEKVSASAAKFKSYSSSALKQHFQETLERLVSEKSSTAFGAPTFQLSPAGIAEIGKFISDLETVVWVSACRSGRAVNSPTPQAFLVAAWGCVKMVEAGFSSPRAKVLPEGTLGGYWRRGDCYAAIDFEEDGEHLWTVTDGQNFKSGTWKVSEKVPKAIDIDAVP